MFTKFQATDEEKQLRVIGAALKQFSEKNYSTASTNEIAKEAGISKGLLFHYFMNKKTLYLFMYDYAIRVISEEVVRKVNFNEKDLFVRMSQVAELKLTTFQTNPYLLKFIERVFFEEDVEVKLEIEDRKKQIATSEYYKLFSEIDTSKFKEGIDAARAVNVILWTLEGLGESVKAQHKLDGKDLDMNEIMEEFNRYMELLRINFCK
ncbi:TetR/AcrR family transcriptional regulator [Paenibacillus sp. GSMTC-2017]|uniref:TetR/AcrR family transcriptional regulator n=1 Tax=Paenibacillus sp. GSMTC-2017 TaxID=2794350 RepID=UPI0018D707D3|nr:TetR/AcrR family transcriptional regulator [Paenibacillus sp. GSMTC-2017]